MSNKKDTIKDLELIGEKKIRRWMKYESQLDPTFKEKIARLAFGETVLSCIQCGTCSGTCPVSHYMDYTPRRIIAMVREGFKEDVLHSFTIWLCASCYSCTVDCPREIKITDIMYALKQEAISDGAYPERFAIPILAKEFFKQVERNGRNTEMPLIMKLYLKTNIMGFLRDADVGIRLFLKGRIPLKIEKIKQVEELRTLLKAAEAPAPGDEP
ncbi:4Fe-4S dicluster domain-containing protein [candidate division CSSED10-310 bacterium]|uniref:4Fe-4S dicluster domain-containing protein n=1 Tax=candidate division CSSED10-310 bacterium TaxID=2855610 RepID=A0ABV6Z160_UNCC1